MLKKYIAFIQLAAILTLSHHAQAMDKQTTSQLLYYRPQYYYVTSNEELACLCLHENNLYLYPRPKLSANHIIDPELYQHVVRKTLKINAYYFFENEIAQNVIDFHIKSLNNLTLDDLIDLTKHNQKLINQWNKNA